MNNKLSLRLTLSKQKTTRRPVSQRGSVNKINSVNSFTPVVRSIPPSMPNKNMEWGTVTWKMFHWLAANINEEFYINTQTHLHSIIINILYNLPCPSCKSHAIEFTKQHDITRAKTKEQFIQFFYFFHNKVNERKDLIIPNRSILDIYTKMNGVDVINEWAKKFKNNLGINMNDFMNKQNIAEAKQRMINFIKANRAQFSNL